MMIRTTLRIPLLTALAVAAVTLPSILAMAAGVNPWTGILLPVLHEIAGWF